MNGKNKKALSLLLIGAIVFGLFAVSASAAPLHYRSYVSLGDSITAGCGIASYDRNLENVWVKGAYVDDVRQDVGADAEDSFQGGRGGWRTHEMRVVLEDDYYGDSFTEDFFPYWGAQDLRGLISRRDTYRNAIRNADLITICFGNNDIAGRAVYSVIKIMEVYASDEYEKQLVHDAVEHAKGTDNANLALDYLLNASKSLDEYLEIIAALPKAIDDGMDELYKNWDCIIKDVRELNPTADIVAVGMYNPLGVKLNSGLVKLITDPFFDQLNYYFQYGSAYCNEYEYADVSKINLTAEHSPDGVHPDETGHRYIADKIMEVLASYTHCAHEHTMIINDRPATILGSGYTGDTICADCGKLIEQGAVIVLGQTISVPRNIVTYVSDLLNGFVSSIGNFFSGILGGFSLDFLDPIHILDIFRL